MANYDARPTKRVKTSDTSDAESEWSVRVNELSHPRPRPIKDKKSSPPSPRRGIIKNEDSSPPPPPPLRRPEPIVTRLLELQRKYNSGIRKVDALREKVAKLEALKKMVEEQCEKDEEAMNAMMEGMTRGQMRLVLRMQRAREEG